MTMKCTLKARQRTTILHTMWPAMPPSGIWQWQRSLDPLLCHTVHLFHCKHFGFIKVNQSLPKLIKNLNLVRIPELRQPNWVSSPDWGFRLTLINPKCLNCSCTTMYRLTHPEIVFGQKHPFLQVIIGSGHQVTHAQPYTEHLSIKYCKSTQFASYSCKHYDLAQTYSLGS